MTPGRPQDCFLCRANGPTRIRHVDGTAVRLCGDCLTHRPWHQAVTRRQPKPAEKK